MPRACFLIAANADSPFLSQVAAISRALRQLPWTRWQVNIVVCTGGDVEPGAIERWRPHLPDVDWVMLAPDHYARDPAWASSDDALRFARSDADVLVALDADTLPVANLEPVLDEVLADGVVAGLIAHLPVPGFDGMPARAAWRSMAEGLIEQPLEFGHACTLLDESAPLERRELPFYVNFGVVFFPRQAYLAWVPEYLALRAQLMSRMHHHRFSGQVALTLALTKTGARTRALPMRYNYPNDPVADRLHPDELANVVVFHYLRLHAFDRHRIFADEATYLGFLAMELEGSDRVFQQAVRRLLGEAYPFGPVSAVD
jgi:hypothetical protein